MSWNAHLGGAVLQQVSAKQTKKQQQMCALRSSVVLLRLENFA